MIYDLDCQRLVGQGIFQDMPMQEGPLLPQVPVADALSFAGQVLGSRAGFPQEVGRSVGVQ
jgi:hypothetical protein